jgi:hypothetical protein
MAALISLLFVFTSISASACDLSCWLRQGHDDCHSGVPISGQETGTAMASAMPMGMAMAMAMGSRQMQHMMAPGEIGMDHRLTPHRLTPMSPQAEMAVERLIELSKPGMSSTALPGHSPGTSRDLSSCAHETCSQIWASASPLGARHADPDFLHYAPVRFSISTIFWTRSNGIKTGSPPPERHAEHLATNLRI